MSCFDFIPISVCCRGIRGGLPGALVVLCAAAHAADPAPSFSRDIQPILSEHCFACHGPDANARKAGLRLDSDAAAHAPLRGGDRAIVPGNRAESVLYTRIATDDAEDRMPPGDSGHTLTGEQIDVIGRWIDAGGQYAKHWAFVPPVRPERSAVKLADWPVTPVDGFVLARMEAKEVTPSPEADRATLLRRVSLDLTGLPPTPEEQDDWLADESPGAYEVVVDRLLASPRYGEKWARHWLDVSRYADTNGYSIDARRDIWPWRDWVIDAFNADMPFDQFVTEQMAGDLLPGATRDQKVATGFHRNTMINEEGGIDQEEFRIEAVADRVNTLGTAFLGLTLGCARCHDHKYDPVSQREYFRLFAYLNNDNETTLNLPTPEQEAAVKAARKEAKALRREIHEYIASSEAAQLDWEEKYSLKDLRDLPEEDRAALIMKPDARDDAAKARVLELFRASDRTLRRLDGRLKTAERKRDDIASTLVLAARREPRATHLLTMGDYAQPGEIVTPGIVESVLPLAPERGDTRLDLAKWLVDPQNPLLARVTVNRLWQRLFGTGIVATENDFGAQGSLPTHPELLDWLAVEFVENGWHIKPLIKQIVMSATYRQDARPRPDLKEVDPANALLARQNRVRLDAEIIRDAALTAAGVLDDRIGGPGVFPPQPDGVTTLGQRKLDWETSTGPDRFRRGLYTAFWRATPYYGLTVFDAPDAQTSCTRRVRSNTPLQALTLLNDPSFVELARELAARLMEEPATTPEDRIAAVFKRCLARAPTETETRLLLGLHADQREQYARDPARAAAAFGPDSALAVEGAAWMMVARAMLNLDEFVTRE